MLSKEKIQELVRFCGSAFMAVATTQPVQPTSSGQLAVGTFGIGGPGAVLVQLMLIGIVGWLLSYLTLAAGQGQISGMIKVVTIFTCIGMVAKSAWGAIKTVAAIAGY